MILFKDSKHAIGATTTMPKHSPGDLIIVYAYNQGSTTIPSLGSGFTSIGTSTGTTCAERAGYKIATTTSETVGTWTNATFVFVKIYSGAVIGASSTSSGTGSTITIPSVTLQNTDNTSYVSYFYGSNTADGFPEEVGTPANSLYRGGFESRASGDGYKGQIFNTSTTVSSFTSKTIDIGFSSPWLSRVIELKRAPVGSNATFSFTLPSSARTSAAVYQTSTDVLLRTLWSNVEFEAGTHTEEWDKRNDSGTLLSMASGPYSVKVVSNNITYSWNGVIGNTSDSTYGPNKFNSLRGCYDMSIHNDSAYCAMGFQEGKPPLFKIDLATSLHSKTNLLFPGTVSVDLDTVHSDTDGTTVYWAGFDSFNQNLSFVYGTNVSNDSEKQFSSGSSATCTYGREYQWAIDINTVTATAQPSGIAVMKTGNYLFVAHEGQDQLRVLNKSTGAFVRNITYSNPKRIRIDANDILWVVTDGSVKKHTINGDGTISSPSLAIIGLTKPLSIGCSKDGTLISVIDGGASQQVKTYLTSTGVHQWTLGQAGGYTSNAQIANDKFMFDHPILVSFAYPFIEYDSSGNFYLGDPGNMRVLKFNSSRVHQDTLQSLRMIYTISANRSNPSQIFGDFLQFSRNRSIPLGPRNNSWTLTHNWAGGLDSAHVPVDDLNARNRFKDVITFSNGRTYAGHLRYAGDETPSVEIVELVEGGTISYTGVILPEWKLNYSIMENGDIIYEDTDRNTVGSSGNWKIKAFLGFSPNATWDTEAVYNNFPTVATTNVGYKESRSTAFTDSNKLIVFAQDKFNTSNHLGAVKKGESTYSWQASPSTNSAYTGTFRNDGYFDTGNGVEYAGGDVLAAGNHIFWNYVGEFWKNSQTNKWNHYYDNGILLGHFGKSDLEAARDDGSNFAPRESAGNAFSTAIIEEGGDLWIYHGDESIQSGVHEWQISGLDTIQEHTIVLESNYSVETTSLPITISFNDVTFTYSGDSVTGYELDSTSLPVSITFNDVTTFLSGYDLVSDSIDMPIVFREVTFFLNSPSAPQTRNRFNIFRVFRK